MMLKPSTTLRVTMESKAEPCLRCRRLTKWRYLMPDNRKVIACRPEHAELREKSEAA